MPITIQLPGSRTGVLTGMSGGGGFLVSPSVSSDGASAVSQSLPTPALPSGSLPGGSGPSLLSVSSGWAFGHGLGQAATHTMDAAAGGSSLDSAFQAASPSLSRSGPTPGTYDATGHFEPMNEGAADGFSARTSKSAAAERGASPAPGGGGQAAEESDRAPRGRTREAEVVQARRLAPEAEAVIRQLRSRDSQVKAHYSAQAAAGGAQSSVASYRYTVGPDGQRYATDGSISFHMNSHGTPHRMASQARAVRMAALAPANAGPRDLAVAAAAMRVELDARADVRDALAAEHAKDVGRFEDHTAPDPVVSELERGHAIENAAEDVGSTYSDELAADTFVNRPDYLDAEGAVRG